MLKNKIFEYFFLNPKNQRNSTVVQIMCEYTTINIICQSRVHKAVHFGAAPTPPKARGQGLTSQFEREQDMIGLSGAMSGVGRCNSDTVLITDVGVLLQYVACSRSLARLGALYLRITEINISLFYVANRQPFIRRNLTRPLRPIFLGGPKMARFNCIEFYLIVQNNWPIRICVF